MYVKEKYMARFKQIGIHCRENAVIFWWIFWWCYYGNFEYSACIELESYNA